MAGDSLLAVTYILSMLVGILQVGPAVDYPDDMLQVFFVATTWWRLNFNQALFGFVAELYDGTRQPK